MRLGVDATGVFPSGKGITRVQRGIVQALRARGAPELVVFSRHPEELGGDALLVRPRLTLLWEQLGLLRRGRGLDAFLTWTERLPLAGGPPFVVWLYEVPQHRIEQNRRSGAGAYQRLSDLVTQLLWRRSLRRAAWVLTGSAATETELLALAPELSGKTSPLLAALDDRFRPGVGPAAPPYLFHLGSSDARDNTETVLDAYRLLRDELPSAPPLVVAGGLDTRAEALRARAPAGVELRGRVSDEELVALYQGATAFVDASLYEGFGYQVLEAMACGAPVVASNTTSIPEVVGEAGILCDPRSPEAFADALRRLLERPELAAELRAKGLARAAEFSWARTVEELVSVLERLPTAAST
jgi:glycosyltransferase involved in cell wall biosynthesis